MAEHSMETPSLNQISSTCVKVHTCQTAGQIRQVAEILLARRSVVLDTNCFVTIMQSGSPILAFPDTFHMALLNHDTKGGKEHPTVASYVLSLDIRDAKAVWVLPESLVDYAVRQNIPAGSLDLTDLPFGIRVAAPNHNHLSSEVIMRAAVSKRTSVGASTEEVIASAILFNSIIHQLSYAFVSGAVFVSSEAAFFRQFKDTIYKAKFNTLEYLTVQRMPHQLQSATKDLLLRSSLYGAPRRSRSLRTLFRSSKPLQKSPAEQQKVPSSPRKWLMNIMNEEHTTKKLIVSKSVIKHSAANTELLYPEDGKSLPPVSLPPVTTELPSQKEKRRPPALALPSRPERRSLRWTTGLSHHSAVPTPPYSPSIYSSLAPLAEDDEVEHGAGDPPLSNRDSLYPQSTRGSHSAPQSPFTFDYF